MGNLIAQHSATMVASVTGTEIMSFVGVRMPTLGTSVSNAIQTLTHVQRQSVLVTCVSVNARVTRTVRKTTFVVRKGVAQCAEGQNLSTAFTKEEDMTSTPPTVLIPARIVPVRTLEKCCVILSAALFLTVFTGNQ